jgi:quercetin dioxygenase-like cupin family protein
MSVQPPKAPIVRHCDEVEPMDCPYGSTCRVVTAGEGGVANVHIIRVTRGLPHIHAGYDEVYYVLAGTGTISIDGTSHPLRPGSVAVIPAGAVHSLEADPGAAFEFVIFGTPPVSLDDERARPQAVD